MAFKPLTVSTPIGEKAHVLAEDDAALYDGIFGEDCVLKLGEQFASKTISNNVIRVMDGVVVVGGHVGRIIKGDYEDMMIDNGIADQKRNDLIVARFQSGGTGGADTYSLVVVKGTPGSTARDPAIVQEDLYAGGKQRDYPLYRVRIENLSVVGVDKLFKVNRNFKVLAEELDKTGEKIDSVNQTLEERTGKELRLYVNKEGGTIEFTEKGTDRKWRMNLLNGVFRLYAERPGDNYCVYSFPTTEAGGKGGTVGTVEQISKKMDKMTVVNNATTTGAGTVLDGRMGKILNDRISKYHEWRKIGYATSGSVSLKTVVDASEYLVFVKFNATASTEGIVTINIPAIAPSGNYFEGYDYGGTYTGSICVEYSQGNYIKLLPSWCTTNVPAGEAITKNFRFEVYAR